MLSMQALHIISILEQQDGQPVTAKRLSAMSGISERSVKTYINEVADFCKSSQSTLIRKPGVGFVYRGSGKSRKKLQTEQRLQKSMLSRSYRISYIVYILLTGWNTYTIALFSEELEVSKNTIIEDLGYMEPRLKEFGLRLNRIAGKGITLDGDEFTKRKAFRHFCRYEIEPCETAKSSDFRLSPQEEKVYTANYGKRSLSIAVLVIQKAEGEKSLWFTDYSFKMITEYLAIQLMRMRQEKYLKVKIQDPRKSIPEQEHGFKCTVEKELDQVYGIVLPEEESGYLGLILSAGELQDCVMPDGSEYMIWDKEAVKDVCDDLSAYIGEILSVDLKDTHILQKNLMYFLPASFTRVHYGLEVCNPFLQDVKKMYPGIFAVSFACSRYYKKHADAFPNEQELSFLALFLGGAIMRGDKRIKAVLMGSCGTYIANIIGSRLEERMPGLEVIAICSGEEREKLKHLEYDLILCMQPEMVSGHNEEFVEISSFISETDIKKINKAYFDKISQKQTDRFLMLEQLMPQELMLYIEEKYTKNEILTFLCNRMQEQGYVTEEYRTEVFERESICSTTLGNGIAIPHGSNLSVKKPGVSVVKLKHPIEWGDGNIDIIFLLALNFENIVLTRSFFSEFTKLIEKKEWVEKVRDCRQLEELKVEMGKMLHVV